MKNGHITQKERIDWVDYAKGICIVAVVAMYATGYVEDTMKAHGWMHYFVDFAQPFRMPDFFFLSGLFVARVIDRPRRDYFDTKVLHFLYFYTLWLTLKYVLVESHKHAGSGWQTMLAEYAHLYVQPSGPLWFIAMLPLFFIAVRLLRAVPALAVLAAAIALKLADLDTGWKLVDRFGMYFVFFYTGSMLAPVVFRVVALAQKYVGATLVVLAIWFAVNLALVRMEVTFQPVVHLLAGYAGAFAILILSALLVRLPWMGWLRYLGEHSIVVFLAFVVPLFAMRAFIARYQLLTDVGTISFVLIVASILGSLMMYWAVRNTPLRFLFERPAWASIRAPRRRVAQHVA